LIHSTQKPIKLFEWLIKTYSNEGDLILDNCAGSGTTAIAAKNCNRNWICIEKDDKCYNDALKRLSDNEV
jgi:site-specific DNA-methyltransferase (adenine-specific)